MAPAPATMVGFLGALLCLTPSSFAFVSSGTTTSTRNVNIRTATATSVSRRTTRAPRMMTATGRERHEAAGTGVGGGRGVRGGQGEEAAIAHQSGAVCRGGFFTSLTTAAFGGSALAILVAAPEGANANGMLDTPPARLNNRYFLMRSGQGGSDREGLVQSHPIDKLHMDNRLTEQGMAEAQRAADVLRSLGVKDAFIWADISSRAQDTARILANELGIRQERVVPEYAFLDPRGMGSFDGKDAASVLPQVYKEDAISHTWRPPANTDGTLNESVSDVFVRVRQLMSKLETQYQGEDLIIVGADSDCLSILQAFVLGEDLGQHSKYYLRPGEGRQLRTSLDTEIGYAARREAKGKIGDEEDA